MNELRPDIVPPPLSNAILLESCKNTSLLKKAEDCAEGALMATALILLQLATVDLKGLLDEANRLGSPLNPTSRSQTNSIDKNSHITINTLGD